MTIIELLFWIYAAMLLTVLVHEIGHMGKRIKIMRWFPWIEGASFEARFWWGGLAANFASALVVFTMQPEHIFWQLFGFLNWVHFILYSIFGSFNYEPKVPPSMWKYFVFDDINNKAHGPIMVPLGILTFFLFKGYYLPLIVNIFKQVTFG